MKISENSLALYLHIPFCERKCLYCDFLSAPADAGTRERYVQALFTEIDGRSAEYKDRRVTSVFFGGGTPSLLTPEQITGLLTEIRRRYPLTEDAEITMEVNPGTADLKKLCVCREGGVNRLSIGLQSGDNKELAAIGRIHAWEQFVKCYRWARQAGFGNVNVDLMSALPGQSVESCRATLGKVLALVPRPEHISAYSLILEEGTPLFDRCQKGLLQVPDEETDRLMYQETKRILEEAGYRRYEISNYAREGFCCRHNCGCWLRGNYLGFGIGAASLVDNVRFRNRDSLEDYCAHPLDCREDIQRLSLEEQMEEFMFLGLRLTKGVDSGHFRDSFGSSLEEVYGNVIEKNQKDGLLEYKGSLLALTERGLDLANYVMAQFLF